jgi:hypothetical protein
MDESASYTSVVVGRKSRVPEFFINYCGHDVHACPQIAKALLVVFVID